MINHPFSTLIGMIVILMDKDKWNLLR